MELTRKKMIEQENMKSLAKTFDILEMFLKGPEEISVTEVSRKSGLNKSTCGRIMSKLVKRGYLKQIESRGKYSLGTIFLEYSGIIKSRLKLRDIAMPHLFELSRQSKETAMLAVCERGGSVITESFHDAAYLNSPLKVVPDEGISMPLYCTCLGKIFLANMTEDEIKEYYQNTKFEKRTANTLVTPQKINQQLKEIKKDEFAFDNEEYALGVRGVASALKNIEGEIVGSIGIVAPSVRMSVNDMPKLKPLVKSFALEISRQMGYRGS
jgi:IclR family transcriptional regulator, KDG regulon repressor